MAVNPYMFIVGCPRSGTTLLKRVLNAHSELAITPETHWIPRRLRDGRGLDPDGVVEPELVPLLFEYFRFPRLGVGEHELLRLVAHGLTYAEFVSAIFDAYGRARGKNVVGDKSPPYVREIPLLHALWPEARFVHIIRDGRDVCLSAVNWATQAERFAERFPTWLEDPISTAAFWWKRQVAIGQSDGAALGPELYVEVLYEDLVHAPEETSKRLCAFLGLPYEEQMLRFHEGRTKAGNGLSSKQAWLPITSGLRDWRTQMSADSVACFEAAAGELLEKLGYERAVPTPPDWAAAHVERIERLCAHRLARRRPLPEAVGVG